MSAGATVPGLACPQCGGENVLPSGERILPCAFCGASLFVDRAGLVSHYRLPRLLDRAAAEQALRRWMAGNETVKDLDSTAEVVEVVPVSFPVWMFRRRGERGESVVAEPAAATPEPQMADLQVPAGKLEPYRPEEGPVEAVAASVPLATAQGWLAQAAGGGEVTETALVHVPFWRASYRFGGETYGALVEGSTGAVLASVFPAKAEAPFLLVAILGLLAFGAEGFLIVNPLWKLVAYGLTAVPLALMAWWVTSRV